MKTRLRDVTSAITRQQTPGGMNHHNVYKGKALHRPSGAPSPRENSSAVTFGSVLTPWHTESKFQSGMWGLSQRLLYAIPKYVLLGDLSKVKPCSNERAVHRVYSASTGSILIFGHMKCRILQRKDGLRFHYFCVLFVGDAVKRQHRRLMGWK